MTWNPTVPRPDWTPEYWALPNSRYMNTGMAKVKSRLVTSRKQRTRSMRM